MALLHLSIDKPVLNVVTYTLRLAENACLQLWYCVYNQGELLAVEGRGQRTLVQRIGLQRQICLALQEAARCHLYHHHRQQKWLRQQ
jgi:hypothetical protein